MLGALILCFFVTIVLFEVTEANVIVRIRNGAVKGRKAFTVGRKEPYYAFQGIPYAEPPIGHLRFKPPLPKNNWAHTLDATSDESACVQGSSPVTGSENCLFINVYTPKLPESHAHSVQLPTMVFIHGGVFRGGNSTYGAFGPDYLLEKDVVVVTFNYRIGVFGYLSTEDLVVSGNNGFKDQVLALKWVQRNIETFGGDPTRVTIFGQSSGSVSVSYHLQSPLSKGLFHGAIMQSGVSLCPWGLNKHPLSVAKSIAKYLSIETKNVKNMVDHLRNASYADLQAATAKATIEHLATNNLMNGLALGPVIEPHHDQAFFSAKSHQLLKEGNFIKVPCLIGFNSLEGTFDFQAIFRLFLMQYDLIPSLLAPDDLNMNSFPKRVIVGLRIKDEYFGLTPLSLSTEKLTKFLSDHQFLRAIREFVRQIYDKVPTYFYRFSYEGGLWGIKKRDISGVTHSEELGYIWRSPYNATEKDALTRERMITLWTNFAKTGNPTPHKSHILQDVIWNRSDAEFTFLEIGDNLSLKKNPEKDHMLFWDNIYHTFGGPPFDTY